MELNERGRFLGTREAMKVPRAGKGKSNNKEERAGGTIQLNQTDVVRVEGVGLWLGVSVLIVAYSLKNGTLLI